jgi:hypothetical protein
MTENQNEPVMEFDIYKGKLKIELKSETDKDIYILRELYVTRFQVSIKIMLDAFFSSDKVIKQNDLRCEHCAVLDYGWFHGPEIYGNS